MGGQRQDHPLPSGSCVQGEILPRERGVESGRYTWDMKNGQAGEEMGWKRVCMDIQSNNLWKKEAMM